MIKGSCPFPAIGWERAAFALSGNPNHSSDLLHKDNLLPPPAKRGIMRNEFRQPDEQNMRQLLHQDVYKRQSSPLSVKSLAPALTVTRDMVITRASTRERNFFIGISPPFEICGGPPRPPGPFDASAGASPAGAFAEESHPPRRPR